MAYVDRCHLGLRYVEDHELRVLADIDAFDICHVEGETIERRTLSRVDVGEAYVVVGIKRHHLRIVAKVEVRVHVLDNAYFEDAELLESAWDYERSLLGESVVAEVERLELSLTAEVDVLKLVVAEVEDNEAARFCQVNVVDVATACVEVVELVGVAVDAHHALFRDGAADESAREPTCRFIVVSRVDGQLFLAETAVDVELAVDISRAKHEREGVA